MNPFFPAILMASLAALTAGADPPEPSAIYINLSGYRAASEKIALISAPVALPVSLLDAETEEIVWSGMPALAEGYDRASGSRAWTVDFSIISATGRYKLTAPGGGLSAEFAIADSFSAEFARAGLKAFYHWRVDADFTAPEAEQWQRQAPKPAPVVVHPATSDPQTIPLAAGWHDGSGPGQYVSSGVHAAGLLMTAFEWLPDTLGGDDFGIPESGNGVPDILDETRHELEWLLLMQREDGAVHHKLTGLQPESDDKLRYLMPPSTAATAGASAALAKASRLYAPYDATFASRCLQSAVNAWRFIELNPNDGGFANPDGVTTKSYSDPDDSDERFWAAVELRLALDDERMDPVLEALAEQRVPLLSSSGYWGDLSHLAAAAIINTPTESIWPDLAADARLDLIAMAESLARRSQDDAFRLTLDEEGFAWGSNGLILQNALILFWAERIDERDAFRRAALDQIHYLLGRNPVGISYVTGFGERSPANPYGMKRYQGASDSPLPGVVAGGPNPSLNDNALKARFTRDAPPATVYLDEVESFSSNEFHIGWNAAWTAAAAFATQTPPAP